MHVLVVHESFFGNTARLAESVATGLRSGSRAPDRVGVLVESVTTAPTSLAGVDLLVVGGPTHLLTLSSPLSRWLQAQYWGDPEGPRRSHRPYGRPTRRTSLRDWLAALPAGPRPPVAVFDTRVHGRRTGGAGPVIARRLLAGGHHLVQPPAAFYVSGIHGPLVPGEPERAVAWGRSLAPPA